MYVVIDVVYVLYLSVRQHSPVGTAHFLKQGIEALLFNAMDVEVNQMHRANLIAADQLEEAPFN